MANLLDPDWSREETEHTQHSRLYDVLVLEYCDGTLAQLKKTSLSLNQSRNICRQLLEGLVQLGGSSVIHNDLKPSNILYKTSGQVDQDGNIIYEIRIADFGTANRSGGTPGWTLPNFWGDRKTGVSDSYSIGLLILYVMCESEELFYRLRDNYVDSGADWMDDFRNDLLVNFVIQMMNLELSVQESLVKWDVIAPATDIITRSLLKTKYRIPTRYLNVQDGMDPRMIEISLIDK